MLVLLQRQQPFTCLETHILFQSPFPQDRPVSVHSFFNLCVFSRSLLDSIKIHCVFPDIQSRSGAPSRASSFSPKGEGPDKSFPLLGSHGSRTGQSKQHRQGAFHSRAGHQDVQEGLLSQGYPQGLPRATRSPQLVQEWLGSRWGQEQPLPKKADPGRAVSDQEGNRAW